MTIEIVDSVVHSSKVFSHQYQAKTVITADGQSYTKIVGSGGESELLVLQVDGKKVRVPAHTSKETVPSRVPVTPEG